MTSNAGRAGSSALRARTVLVCGDTVLDRIAPDAESAALAAAEIGAGESALWSAATRAAALTTTAGGAARAARWAATLAPTTCCWPRNVAPPTSRLRQLCYHAAGGAVAARYYDHTGRCLLRLGASATSCPTDALTPDVLCVVDHDSARHSTPRAIRRMECGWGLGHHTENPCTVFSTKDTGAVSALARWPRRIVQWAGSAADVRDLCRIGAACHRTSALLLTAGVDGAWLWYRQKVHEIAPGYRSACAHNIGAGDIVSGLLAGLLARDGHAPLLTLAARAVRSASYVLAQPPRRAADESAALPVDRQPGVPRRQYRYERRMAAALHTTRARVAAMLIGRKAVFVPGCFDMLHAGHEAVLRAASQLHADRRRAFVVGLCSDDSIKRAKGADRPLQRFALRAAAVAACMLQLVRPDDVVYVVQYDYGYDVDVMRELSARWAALVKGADWCGCSIPGSKQADQVVLVPTVPGVSTTLIAQAMLARAGGYDGDCSSAV